MAIDPTILVFFIAAEKDGYGLFGSEKIVPEDSIDVGALAIERLNSFICTVTGKIVVYNLLGRKLYEGAVLNVNLLRRLSPGPFIVRAFHKNIPLFSKRYPGGLK